MTGTLTDKNDYYQGNYTLYGLKEAVARAGGHSSHVDLFNLLVSSTFPAFDKDKRSYTILFDYRAPQSMLFLLPPKLQIPIAALFYVTELCIKADFADDSFSAYDVQPNIILPSSIIHFGSNITRLPLGRHFTDLLTNLPPSTTISKFWEDQLKLLLCINTKERLYNVEDRDIRDKLNRIINIINFPSPYLNLFKNISSTNDRIEAAIIIAKRLNYSRACIQLIVSTIESWLLSNI